MRKALIAGGVYFTLVFSLGVILGVLRVTVVAPRLGMAGAMAVELPIMLAVSWLVCGGVIKRLEIGAERGERGLMSATALVLIVVAELALARVLAGQTFGEVLASYRSMPALMGLATQVAFVLFPLFRLRQQRFAT
ncbi:MAG: hypothetical protein ACOYM5_09905 [Caulobacter sp.]